MSLLQSVFVALRLRGGSYLKSFGSYLSSVGRLVERFSLYLLDEIQP